MPKRSPSRSARQRFSRFSLDSTQASLRSSQLHARKSEAPPAVAPRTNEPHAALASHASLIFGNRVVAAALTEARAGALNTAGSATSSEDLGPERLLHAVLALDGVGLNVGNNVFSALGNDRFSAALSEGPGADPWAPALYAAGPQGDVDTLGAGFGQDEAFGQDLWSQTVDTVLARRASNQDNAGAGNAQTALDAAEQSAGQRLPGSLKTELEARFGGVSFEAVRIHTDGAAQAAATAIDAAAYTMGTEIWFGPGQFAPNTEAGMHLLAHELTHVLQNLRGDGRTGGGGEVDGVAVSMPSDAREVEAEAVAHEVMRGESPVIADAGALGEFADAAATASAETSGPAVADRVAGATGGHDGGDDGGGPKQVTLPDGTVITVQTDANGGHYIAGPNGEHLACDAEGKPTSDGLNKVEVTAPPPVVPPAPAVDPDAVDATAKKGEGKSQGGKLRGGGAPGQKQGVKGDPSPAPAAGPTGAPPGLDGLGTDVLALIHEEMVEHQRWQGASNRVGEAGSTQRASFIAEQAGSGALSGAATGFGLGFAMGAVGKLAAHFVPIPGVGAILGGAMSIYGLATRDWKQTGETIGKFGEGNSTYEVLANSLASVSEIIDLVVNIMNVIAGVIGVISAVMWIISIVTVGLASPIAGTLSAIALGIGAASGVLDVINNLVLQPCILLFRALHTFKDTADPREVEAEGAGISDAANKAASALGGMVGSNAGERAGDGIAARVSGGGAPTPASTTPEAPATRPVEAEASVTSPEAPRAQPPLSPETPRAHTPETPRAGAREAPRADGPDAPRADGPDAPRADGPDAPRADGPDRVADPAEANRKAQKTDERLQDTRSRGIERIREEFRAHQERMTAAQATRARTVEEARERGRKQRTEAIEAERSARHQELDAAHQQRMESLDASRPPNEMEAGQMAHEHRIADMKAAHANRMADLEASSQRTTDARGEISRSSNERLQRIDQEQMRVEQHEARMEQHERAALARAESPEVRTELERKWASEREQRLSDARIKAASDRVTSHAQARAELEQLHQSQQQADAQSQSRYEEAVNQAQTREQQALQAGRESRAKYEADMVRAEAERTGGKSEADAHAAGRQGEIDGAGTEAAANATQGADQQYRETAAASERQRSDGTYGNRWAAVKEGMHTNHKRYMVQEDWRPDWIKRLQGKEDGARAKAVDYLWDYVEVLGGPFVEARRGHLNADGTDASGPQLDWSRQHSESTNTPYSRDGNQTRLNEKAASPIQLTKMLSDAEERKKKEASPTPSAYTKDNRAPAGRPESANTYDLVQTERFNPNYQDPPGTPEQLTQMQADIQTLLGARAQAETAANAMHMERDRAMANEPGIGQCVDESAGALTAIQAHKDAVERTDAANQEQQQRQTDAQGLIAGYPSRAAGLGVIKAPLAAFRGFTWIAGKLPGRAGRAMRGMNADADKMNKALSRMDLSMSEQAAEQPEHAAKLQEEGAKLDTTAEKADSSHTALETAQQGAKNLFAKNNRSITDSGAAEEEAKCQSEELTDAADQKRAEKESLQAQLQTWATSHRAARLDAMDRQRSAASTPAALWSDLD